MRYSASFIRSGRSQFPKNSCAHSVFASQRTSNVGNEEQITLDLQK